MGLGLGGKCVCSNCGYEVSHNRGQPCMFKKCPECGTKLVRKI